MIILIIFLTDNFRGYNMGWGNSMVSKKSDL